MVSNGHMTKHGASRQCVATLAGAGDLALGHLEEVRSACTQSPQHRFRVLGRTEGIRVEACEGFVDELAAAEDALIVLPAFAAAAELGEELPAAGAAAQAAALHVHGSAVAQTVVDEAGVGTARLADLGAELREDKVDILGREGSLAEENRVARPRIGIESFDSDR
jgi:hypothetical protein